MAAREQQMVYCQASYRLAVMWEPAEEAAEVVGLVREVARRP